MTELRERPWQAGILLACLFVLLLQHAWARRWGDVQVRISNDLDAAAQAGAAPSEDL